MNKELIMSGIIGIILGWAVWTANFPAAIVALIVGLISLIWGLVVKK